MYQKQYFLGGTHGTPYSSYNKELSTPDPIGGSRSPDPKNPSSSPFTLMLTSLKNTGCPKINETH